MTPARPNVIHYTGHRISGATLHTGFPADQESRVADAIAATLDGLRPVAGLGSLAAGADILIAEALISRRVALHLVFPFGIRTFRSMSVQPSGAAWLDRFDLVLPQATTVKILRGRPTEDDAFGRCTKIAIDAALKTAASLQAEPLQIAIWDGKATTLTAGTAADVAQWRSRGWPARIISPVP